MPHEPLRIGLIGTGQNGRGHIGCVNANDAIELVAMADPHEPSIAEAKSCVRGDVAVYEDYCDLLAKADVEAVIIATPNYTHADVAVASLKAGKHVLGEKPMAITLADCDRMIAARDASGKVLQIGLEYRSDPIMNKIARVVAAGTIGRPYSLWIKEFRGPFMKKVGRWITKKDLSGDTLLEKDCHHYDLFNWFADSPVTSVAAFGGQDVEFEDDRADVIDNAWSIHQHANNARSALGLCMFCDRGGPGLEIGVIGAEGKLEHSTGKDIEVHLRRDSEVRRYNADPPEDIAKLSHQGGVYYEHLNWCKAIREGAPVPATAEIARESVLVALACQQSIAEHRVVDVEKEFRR